MKRNFAKSKSFTLIEILISVTIFVIVSVLVMASLALLVNSKSKTIGLNELRTEGGKILVEVQDMVQKGNGVNFPMAISPGVIVNGKPACTNITDGTQLDSYQTDYRGWTINRQLFFDSTTKQVKERKAIYGPTGTEIARRTDIPINSDRVEIQSFVITGTYRSAACGTAAVSTNLKVTLTVASKAQGTPSQLTLDSVFNSQFPYPDRGFDSVPQVFY